MHLIEFLFVRTLLTCKPRQLGLHAVPYRNSDMTWFKSFELNELLCEFLIEAQQLLVYYKDALIQAHIVKN